MGFLAFAVVGCQQYDWQRDFQAAEAKAREQNKYLFVFYKYWRDTDSNQMLSGEVLSDPKVVALFQDTVNVLIDQDFGPGYVEYVGKYGVQTVPASILVAPDGTFHVLKGFVSKERFIEFVQRAKSPRPGGAGRSAPADHR